MHQLVPNYDMFLEGKGNPDVERLRPGKPMHGCEPAWTYYVGYNRNRFWFWVGFMGLGLTGPTIITKKARISACFSVDFLHCRSETWSRVVPVEPVQIFRLNRLLDPHDSVAYVVCSPGIYLQDLVQR